MKKILYLFAIIFLCSCSNNKNHDSDLVKEKETSQAKSLTRLTSGDPVSLLICQNWKVTDAKPPLPKDLEAFGEITHGQPALHILNDKTIVENPLGEDLRNGSYTLTDHTLKVSFDDGGKSDYVIKRVTPGFMTLRRLENGRETVLSLSANGESYKNASDNPFHPEYSYWRIKPSHAEDDNALKKRLVKYMDFYIKLFQDFLDRDLTTMEFGVLPCCFNWYKGGIGIQSEKNLDQKWVNCFYSKDQAFKARDILEKAVLRKHKWEANVPNWVEQTVPVLVSIRDSL